MGNEPKNKIYLMIGAVALAGVLCFICIVSALNSVVQTEYYLRYDRKKYMRSSDVPAVYIEDALGVNINHYVDCKIVAVDKNGGEFSFVADKNATVKIRGNSTSGGAKAPYNIKFSTDTDLFGMGKGKKYCLIANMFDPTLIRNHTVFQFAQKLGLQYTLDSMLVDVYFNGTYVGCYQLCEAVTDGISRVDISIDEGDYIIEYDSRQEDGVTYITTELDNRFAIKEPGKPTEEQKNAVEEHLKKAEEAIKSGDFYEISKYFDIASIIDFYICLELFKNVDVIMGSTLFYSKNGKIYGGPVWDYDMSSGNCSADYYVDYNNNYGDSAQGIWCSHIWYDDLMQVSEYREAFNKRYLEIQDIIVNLYKDNELGKNAIDSIIESASQSIQRNFSETPWQVDSVYVEMMRPPESTYQANVEHFRNWLERRNNWLIGFFGLEK